MRSELELPRLSLQERDRRWTLVRNTMREKGLDCLLLFGWPSAYDFYTANARYVCPIGGNSTTHVLVFPLEGEPTSFVGMPTFVGYWRIAQNWVADVRARSGSWADTVAGQIRKLGLEKANIGMDGLGGPLIPDGWVPNNLFTRLRELLPHANVVNIDDMLEKIRTIKSAEEMQILDRAARLGDLMLEACRDTARPGVKECEVYARMRHALLANGGEDPTLLLWASDPHPFPHPFNLPTERRLEKGDLIICEMHPKYGGYCTHVERTYSLGKPDPKYLEIYEGCLAAYRSGLELFGPGRSISKALEAVRKTIEQRGLGICEAGIHGHGLGSLEYPRYRHHAIRADQAAIKAMGDEFHPGMVFAFNIDLFDPKWLNGETGCVFAETIAITETGARRMHSFPTEFQTLSA